MFKHFVPFAPKDVLRFDGLDFDLINTTRLPMVSESAMGSFSVIISGLSGSKSNFGIHLSVVDHEDTNLHCGVDVMSLDAAEYLSDWLVHHDFSESTQLLLYLGGK